MKDSYTWSKFIISHMLFNIGTRVGLKQKLGQNLSMDLVSRRGSLGGSMTDRTSLAYWLWCRPASRRACSTRTLGSDTIWKIDFFFYKHSCFMQPLLFLMVPYTFNTWHEVWSLIHHHLVPEEKSITVWQSLVNTYITQYPNPNLLKQNHTQTLQFTDWLWWPWN